MTWRGLRGTPPEPEGFYRIRLTGSHDPPACRPKTPKDMLMDWLSAIFTTWLITGLFIFGLLWSALIVGARADRRRHDESNPRALHANGEALTFPASALA